MKTFKDVREIQLTAGDRNAFRRLKNNEDFVALRGITENYILQLTHNLLVGTETESESSTRELKELRGFVRVWNKITDLVDNKQHYEEEINEQNNGKS